MKLRFDTLEKKPKLYNIAVISGITLVIIIILSVTGGSRYLLAMNIVMALWLVAVIILLIRAFLLQLRYNPYSYNTIYYSGFAIFAVFVLATYCFSIYELIRYNEAYGARPLRRLIQRKIEDQLAEEILGNAYQPGDTILLKLDASEGEGKEKLVFERKAGHKESKKVEETV